MLLAQLCRPVFRFPAHDKHTGSTKPGHRNESHAVVRDMAVRVGSCVYPRVHKGA